MGVWRRASPAFVRISTPALVVCVVAACFSLLAAPALGVTPETASSPRGYPILLGAGQPSGVWFGGATEGSGRPESVDRVDFITAAGTFVDFQFPPELYGYWPEAFAPAGNGAEWFLAVKEGDLTPVLCEISVFGELAVHPLAVPPGSAVQGLAAGPEGTLWTTETRVVRRHRLAAILRLSPSGSATAFSTGLAPNADPEDITAGPEGKLWFVDVAGRIGRVDTSGRIKEFPVAHRIDGAGTFGPPPPIVATRDGSVWFVIDADHLGRLTPSGRIRSYMPPPTLKWPRNGEGEAIENIAPAPNGQLWVTRSSGAVLRIDPRGHVRTATNRLVAGRGIAATQDGTIWVGEEASFRPEDSDKVIPTRVARIDPTGRLTQYPEPPPCHVPFVLGDGPARAAEELRGSYCELAGVRRPAGWRSRHLIVVAQSVRASLVSGYKTPVRLTLGRKPAPPTGCRAPRYVKVIADSDQIITWKNPIVEADGEYANATGAQTYVACVPGHRAKHVFMTEELGSESYAALGVLRTAGHLVAFTETSADHYNAGGNRLTLYDALRGKTAFAVEYQFSEGSNAPTVSAFTLNASGDLAWVKHEAIWSTTAGGPERVGELDTLLVRYDGRVHTIETTNGISGLTIEGRVLSWQAGPQAHSFIIP